MAAADHLSPSQFGTPRHDVVNGLHRVALFGDDPESDEAYGDLRPKELSYIEYRPQDEVAHVTFRETRDHLQGQGMQQHLQDALHARHPSVVSDASEMSANAEGFHHKYLQAHPAAKWSTT